MSARRSGSICGEVVTVAPVAVMVAERSGLSRRMARPERARISQETTRAVKTIVRWASIASRARTNIGRAAGSVLDTRNEASTCQSS